MARRAQREQAISSQWIQSFEKIQSLQPISYIESGVERDRVE